MLGSKKQSEWAKNLYKRLHECYMWLEAKMASEEADAWKKAYEYCDGLINAMANEDRSWVVIDALKGLSADPEKAAKQMRYKAWNTKAGEQKAEGDT